MALLTGPAGAGKTALVKVLAKELNCELKEWSNPIAGSYDESSFPDRRNAWSGTCIEKAFMNYKLQLLNSLFWVSQDILMGGGEFALVIESPPIRI